jgi:hypothetical protein
MIIGPSLFNAIGDYNRDPEGVKKNIPVSGIINKGKQKKGGAMHLRKLDVH